MTHHEDMIKCKIKTSMNVINQIIIVIIIIIIIKVDLSIKNRSLQFNW